MDIGRSMNLWKTFIKLYFLMGVWTSGSHESLENFYKTFFLLWVGEHRSVQESLKNFTSLKTTLNKVSFYTLRRIDEHFRVYFPNVSRA